MCYTVKLFILLCLFLTLFSAQLKRLHSLRFLIKRNHHKVLTSATLNVGPSMRNAAVYNNLLLILTKCSREDLKALRTTVQITRIKKAKNMKSFSLFPLKYIQKKKERDNPCTKSQLLLLHEALTHQRPTVETPRDRCERSYPSTPPLHTDLSFYTPK